ncbi:aminoglycoside phosphotransferase family protein [Ensifer sp. ENS07]|jgi:aminoglycoside phosphotransferase (APT) family kinase protein|uniref:Aminoglycoside phosphotransferase family protein n=1 Tax=Ensifer adhaerens TaxID=106592 RepID=A0A9Q8Y5K2_ENSAD|nr:MULTISPECIES: aminoglycoside phosphotransferase family protein [Ensifer]MBD9593492.1 aminoglycoside phosphotransferase family protein [Ensifer sp. ENS05]MBD9640815.1 aminoglycoside phosphotransferase family protein [Ensifer sp. ENS07]USJ22815.1 aminoglycoside phosphotransferase family protein [Ensifer adhaerens]UTV36138.1 aminoglycoside phosphotransferase family protein [Ensifer adhaerens]SDL92596.1 Predicted kinase, aminoglycoside phosphotransferase (APT) family [Ensifer sp. YR511]
MTEPTSATPSIDVPLVRRLLAAQFPQWSELDVRPIEPGGWDNRTFRLGDRMTVRLPSAEHYVLQVEKEHRWLPLLASQLPLPIPVPLGKGVPGEGFPWPWSVYRYLPGQTLAVERVDDVSQVAKDLARFLRALMQADAIGAPLPGDHNFHRGGPPAFYDAQTRQALTLLADNVDTTVAAEVWEAALAASFEGAPVWFHGDIAWGNLLVENGSLSGVIDFGTSGVGDPACDLAIAWTFFDGESREVFRDGMALDRGAWARGRGWTLWKALIVLADMTGAPASEKAKQRVVIDEVLADHRRYG